MEEALHQRRMVEEALGGRALVEEALDQRRMMEEARGQLGLAEGVMEQRRMVEEALEQRAAIDTLMLPSLEGLRLLESALEERRAIEAFSQSTALVREFEEQGRFLREMEQEQETYRRMVDSVRLPPSGVEEALGRVRELEDSIRFTRLADNVLMGPVRFQDIAAQLDLNREFITRWVSATVPSLDDVPSSAVAARLTDTLADNLTAQLQAGPESEVLGPAAILRFALSYDRSVATLPAEWRTPEMQVALESLRIALVGLIVGLLFGVITLGYTVKAASTDAEAPTSRQLTEMKDSLLAEQRRANVLAESTLVEQRKENAVADSNLAEQRRNNQLLEAIQRQGAEESDTSQQRKP